MCERNTFLVFVQKYLVCCKTDVSPFLRYSTTPTPQTSSWMFTHLMQRNKKKEGVALGRLVEDRRSLDFKSLDVLTSKVTEFKTGNELLPVSFLANCVNNYSFPRKVQVINRNVSQSVRQNTEYAVRRTN